MIRSVAVVGFGRFGALLAGLLRPMVDVVVTGRGDRTAEAAAAGLRWLPLAEAVQRDAVILCVPISSVRETGTRIAPYLRLGTLVMDTCSVKSYPLEQLEAVLPASVELLGMHPMFGPDSVASGLAGKQVVLSPVRVAPDRLAEVRGWWESLGAEVLQLTAEEHDRDVAISQGLVHLIGRAVAALGIDAPTVRTANFDRLWALTQAVSNDTWQLFYDLQHLNPYAAPVREQFLQALQSVLQGIDEHRPSDGASSTSG